MADIQTINNGAQTVSVLSQDCEDGCIYDAGVNGEIITLTLPDNTFNNDQTTYRLDSRGKWVPQYKTPQPPSAQNLTVNFGQRADKLQKVFARPVNRTWYLAIKQACDAAASMLIVAPDGVPAAGGGGAMFSSRGAPAEISRPMQYRLDNGHYPVAKASFGGDIYSGLAGGTIPTTAGTGVVFPEPASNCGGSCLDPIGTWYQAHKAPAGAKPYVMFRVNNGPITRSAIAAAANDDNPVGPAVIAGSYLVFAFTNTGANGYLYAQIKADGTLGTWAKVTTGFDTTDPIKGVSADGSALSFAIGGTTVTQVRVASVGSGAVAVTTPLATAINAVHAKDGTVLRAGDDMVIYLSTDNETVTRQVTFTLPVGSAAVAGTTDISAVYLWSDTKFEIAIPGRGFRTEDGGTTWREIAYNTGDVATVITQLIYTEDGQVGWLVQNNLLWRTVTRGFACGSAVIAGWSQDRFIANLPGSLTNMAIGIPATADTFTQANVIAVSGGTASTYLGQPVYAA